MRWADGSGAQWDLTAHWAVIDGRATMVGLDVRSFDDPVDPQPIGDGPAEVTQKVLRAIPLTTVREATRSWGAARSLQNAAIMAGAVPPNEETAAALAEIVASFTATAASFTAKGVPRKRLPAAGSAELEAVAQLYLAAVASGDKTPAKSVEQALRSAGAKVNEVGGRDQVRKWIQRARERGLIPPVSGRS
jgi:hypothetical protein